MSNKFADVFRPERKWENKSIIKANPCKKCPTYADYEVKALYGTIAERQYAELPETCRTCLDKLKWQAECMSKLAWYEQNDPRLKK